MKFELSPKIAQGRVSSRSLRTLALLLILLSVGVWELARTVRRVNAQSRPASYFATASRQLQTSYNGTDHARGVMAGNPAPLSLAGGDLDGDAVDDMAVGFASPSGGLLAIHHGNIDAFAPQTDASFRGIARGEYAVPYLPQADLVEIADRPDFLAYGDLIGKAGSALAAASRGGQAIHILSRNETGALEELQTLTVSGSITGMDVHRLSTGKFSQLTVGLRTASGPRLVIYTGSHAGVSETGNFSLTGDATSFVSGNLDGDPVPDLLVLAGGQISILHSASQALEPVSVPFPVSSAALGRFLQDRTPMLQMALLATDGSLHIMAQSGFDSTPYSLQEMQTRRQNQIATMRQRNGRQINTSATLQRAVTWKEVESTSGIGAPDASGHTPIMFRARVSNNGADDLVFMSSSSLSVFSHPTSQPFGGVISDRTDLGADVVAALPARLTIDARPGVVYVKRGMTALDTVNSQSGASFTVNRTDDPAVPVSLSAVCVGVANDCSLREAIVKSNSIASTSANPNTISVPAGTYTLTIGRAASPNYDARTGTLDVTQSVNIVGAAQATTIIQAGTKGANDAGGPNGVDKVFSFNEDITVESDATVAVSNLTIQNGNNRGNISLTDGWGGAFDCDTGASGNASVTLTNVTLNNNAVGVVTGSSGEGGAFAMFNVLEGGGTVTVTGSTISNNIASSGSTNQVGNGGGIAVEAPHHLTVSNSSITGNKALGGPGDTSPAGGGIFAVGGQVGSSPNFFYSSVTLHGVTISNNSATGPGGGIYVPAALVIDQESIISNNTAGNDGGGIWFGFILAGASPSQVATLSNITVTGNSATGASGGGFGGGIKVNASTNAGNALTMNFSRISGNSSASGASGKQLSLQGINTSSISVTENWWGTNTDPKTGGSGAISVDTADGTPTVNYNPWIVLTLAASPSTIKINTTSTLTGDVAHDSNGATAPLSGHLQVFSGLPVTFTNNGNAAGSVTTGQPQALSASGSATSTYQAGGAGASASAAVTFDGVTATTPIIILQPPSMTKSFNPTTVAKNVSSTVTFAVTNGNTVAIDANFTDTLPTGMVVAATPGLTNACGGTATATAGSGTISFTNAALPVGTCNITVKVSSATDNTYTNSATIDSTIAGNGNTPSATLTVIDPPAIAKAFGAASIPVNGTTSLTFTLSSDNTNLTLNGVAFTDSLPSGMVVATPNNLSNTCGGTATAVAGSSSVTLAGASLTPGATCTVALNVTGTTAGTLNNSVTPTSTNGGTGTVANASLLVVAPPTISKAFGAASFPLNGNTSLTFTLGNTNGSTTLHGVGFSDTLPAGLAIATPNGLSGSCGGGAITATAGTSVVSLSGATLTNTGCTFSVNVTGAAAGTQTNVTGAVTSTEGGTGLTATATTNVVAPPSIAKAFGSGSIAMNATTPLTFTITNPSGNAVSLTGVGFTDSIPVGLTVASGTTSQCGGTLTVTAPVTIALANATIAANSQCQFSVTVTGATAGSYTNTTGAVSSTNGGTGNTASAPLVVIAPSSNTKSFNPTSVPLNGTSVLTISISNPNASQALNGVAFTDSFPGGMAVAATPGVSNTCGGTVTAVAAATSFSLSGGTIAGGGSCAVSVTVTVTTGGAHNNSVVVTSTNGGNGNTASGTLTVATPPTISKAFGAPSIAVGASTSLTFNLGNGNGALSLHNVAFSDTLPAGLTISTPNGLTGSCGGGTITATAGTGVVSLSGATLTNTGCTFAVNVTGTAAGTQNNVTGTVSSTEGGTGLTASASVNVVGAPSIAKTFGSGTIALNATTPLTFTITNPSANTVSLTGVAFTDTIPTGLTVASATSSQCSGTVTVTAPVTIALANATIAANSQCQFSVTVTGASAGSYTNTTGNVTSTNGGTGNTASASLTVGSPAVVTGITSTNANGTYGVGSAIAIQLTFNTVVNVTGTPTLALNSGGTASYTSGSGSATLTFTYTVGAGQSTSGGHLDAASTSALSGTIKDSTNTQASLTVPVGGSAGSLATNKAIVIDTVAPTVVSYSVLFGAQSYNVIGSPRIRLPWQISGIQVVFSKPITQANVASLSGVSTTGFSGLGTNTLTWSIAPVALGNLATMLAGSGPNAITDGGGNPLAGGAGFAQNLKILWGDYNDDGLVNSQDMVGVGNATVKPYDIFADMNGDGVVNTADVVLARSRIGTTLP